MDSERTRRARAILSHPHLRRDCHANDDDYHGNANDEPDTGLALSLIRRASASKNDRAGRPCFFLIQSKCRVSNREFINRTANALWASFNESQTLRGKDR